MPGKDHVTMKFTKGHNSVKSVGGVKAFVLLTLSDNALNTLLFNFGNYYFTRKIPGFRDYYMYN